MEAPGEQPARSGRVAAWRRGFAGERARWLAACLTAIVAAALLLPDPGPLPALRFWTFDHYQISFPRHRKVEAVTIVDIDDRSIQAIGQWPWPRDVLADLVDRVAGASRRAIPSDVLFAEPDRMARGAIAAALRARDPDLSKQLARLRPHDEALAAALRRARAVLGV